MDLTTGYAHVECVTRLRVGQHAAGPPASPKIETRPSFKPAFRHNCGSLYADQLGGGNRELAVGICSLPHTTGFFEPPFGFFYEAAGVNRRKMSMPQSGPAARFLRRANGLILPSSDRGDAAAFIARNLRRRASRSLFLSRVPGSPRHNDHAEVIAQQFSAATKTRTAQEKPQPQPLAETPKNIAAGRRQVLVYGRIVGPRAGSKATSPETLGLPQ